MLLRGVKVDSKVKNCNYVTIQGWMLNELHLKGNDLIVYACIYGFTQDGENTFTGSLQYLADWTNSTKQGVLKNLSSLQEKGLIEKRTATVHGVKFCEYVPKFNGIQQSLIPYSTKFNTPIQQSLPNKKEIDKQEYTIDIKESVKEKTDSLTASRAVKHKHGEYNNVLLTEAEKQKLETEYGVETTAKAITYLDEYIEMKGYKAKSHYLCLRKWVFEALKEREQQGGKVKKACIGGIDIKRSEYTAEQLNGLFTELDEEDER